MGAIPQDFPILSPSSIASYDHTDIADGSGTITYDGLNTEEAGLTATHDYLLTSQAPYSHNIYTNTASVGDAVLDIDFDLTFNRPQRIRGTMYINATSATAMSSASGGVIFVAKVRKWDGTTETEIANNTSGHQGVGAGGKNFFIHCWSVEIPLTHFKKGETLRITLELNSNSSGGGTAAYALFHDPKNRTESWNAVSVTTSTLKFYVPFVLNV